MTILGDGNTGSTGGNTDPGNQGNTDPGNSGGQGGGQGSWIDSLPDDLKTNGSLSNFKDVASLAKSYIHAQGMIGKKGVMVPGEKASDEEWGAFFKSIGQPELDKFELKTPEGKELNGQFLDGFKQLAHKSGLLPKQAQSLMDWYLKTEEEALGNRLVAQENQMKEGLANLRKEWGDGYDKQIALAELPLKEFLKEDEIQALQQKGLTKDPSFIKFLNKVGQFMGEDKLRGDGGGKFGKTPQEIQDEIGKVMSNPAYFDRTHPSHMSLVRQMEGLQRALYGDK